MTICAGQYLCSQGPPSSENVSQTYLLDESQKDYGLEGDELGHGLMDG